MRLICPNCSAQYEVPTAVIPEGGRDVQCSNCGHTWFQNHPDDDPVLAEELNQPLPDTEWRPDDAEADEAEPDETEPDEASDEADEDTKPEFAPPDPVAPEPPRRRELAPEVTDVLREEAEHEARVRAAQGESLESQPDLGLEEPNEDDAARRSREARDRMARMRGTAVDAAPQAAAAAAAAASSRRELLPDIDEINQTLRSSSERRAVETPQGRAPVDEPTGGFGRGFRMMLILAAVAALLYVFAPRIVEMIPAAEPMLAGYVQAIDGARIWLDGQVTALMQSLDGMSSEQGSAPESN